jgi:hypothetical protein
MKTWFVMYGQGRGLRARYSEGDVTNVRAFKDAKSAQAFAAECIRKGLRAVISPIQK